MDTLAPILAKPSLGALRTMLASLGPRSSRADGIRAAEALIAAGIEISNDWGQYHDAEDVIDHVGIPDVYFEGCNFQNGYYRASLEYGYGLSGECRSESEADGADFYRAVHAGIERAIECHQYRDWGCLPSEARAAE